MTTDIYNMGLRFKQVAAANASQPALLGDAPLSYKELDAKSDAAASHMLKTGLKPGQVVAIFAEKQAMTYVSMLAGLKIGTPYVVLDTTSPQARLEKILERCQPALLITENKEFSWNGVKTLTLTELAKPSDPLPDTVIKNVKGETPAYLMFTSGSTGFPKGVTISHASMVNFCDWSRDTFAITPKDRLTSVNPLYFDNSVFDFTASLFNGASLLPVGRDTVKQPKQLSEAVKNCTIWFSVPSLLIYLTTMRALTKDSWPAMRAIIFGGEGFAKAELKKLHALYGAQATLWNVYGPTECTCICSAYAISEKDFEDMSKLAPLGHLAPRFKGAVMDETGTKEVADGSPGELFLMGSQVALGYYNDEERTRASFAKNPLYPDEPCYRTGDLVYRDGKTGYYHFAGRKDNQIKHMGYRIELEEIEAALNGFPEVAQAAVIYHKQAQAGRIVAFVTARETADGTALKSRLRELLPSYMIPEEVEIMPQLPKNANGKVDRKALAAEYETRCKKN